MVELCLKYQTSQYLFVICGLNFDNSVQCTKLNCNGFRLRLYEHMVESLWQRKCYTTPRRWCAIPWRRNYIASACIVDVLWQQKIAKYSAGIDCIIQSNASQARFAFFCHLLSRNSLKFMLFFERIEIYIVKKLRP